MSGLAHRRTSPAWLLLVALAAQAGGACTPYDPAKIRVGDGGNQGGFSGEGGASGGGAPAGGTGGSAGAAMCTDGVESCNRLDDDCDGETDEGARTSCEQIVLNAETDCIAFQNTARCVLLDCRDGYANCDGDPTNGCERSPCSCVDCDDAGGEDAGAEDAGD